MKRAIIVFWKGLTGITKYDDMKVTDDITL